MRFNANTYPAFQVMEKRDFFNLEIDTTISERFESVDAFIAFMHSVGSVWNRAYWKWFVTQTFTEAVLKAIPKMPKDLHTSLGSQTGLLIMDKGFTMYEVSPQGGTTLFGFTKHSLTCCAVLTPTSEVVKCWYYEKNPITGALENNIEKGALWIASVHAVLWFIANCETEKMLVKPGKKERHVATKENYLNETKSDIIVLDCSWFRELVTSAQGVEGYYKWQHYGPRNKYRKFIYIKDFEREISREAKKDTVLNHAGN